MFFSEPGPSVLTKRMGCDEAFSERGRMPPPLTAWLPWVQAGPLPKGCHIVSQPPYIPVKSLVSHTLTHVSKLLEQVKFGKN